MTDDLLLHTSASPGLRTGARCDFRLLMPASILVDDLHTHGEFRQFLLVDLYDQLDA